MALLLPHSVFLHIPKTGGMWVRQALLRSGLAKAELRHRQHAEGTLTAYPHCCKHTRVEDLDDHSIKGKMFFAFVRHPLSYYQSYWAFKMRTGWNHRDIFDQTFAHEDFSSFVRAVTSEKPGWVTSMYQAYLGNDRVHIIGKQETLAEDLIRALTEAGEMFDASIIRGTPKQNEAASLDSWREQCRYTPKLELAVRRSEQEALKVFEYF
ncbi:hypothetical protein A2706_02325 [Candidatus Peribacteria bacterium RIFCSPHIGHO2_01_FULL_51_35]|nr:MAG: hypothetical protein A2706_02325 [Candidatus Peribacteria bacterium RIFCSPHIGHO2_01_FULL_51_35]